jgi:hypothetical protein
MQLFVQTVRKVSVSETFRFCNSVIYAQVCANCHLV